MNSATRRSNLDRPPFYPSDLEPHLGVLTPRASAIAAMATGVVGCLTRCVYRSRGRRALFGELFQPRQGTFILRISAASPSLYEPLAPERTAPVDCAIAWPPRPVGLAGLVGG